MLSVSNLSVQFGKRVLFDEVQVTFTAGNCYGVIGANGAGKSTFLKILSGEMDPTSGQVNLEPGKRMSVLQQNHNAHDSHTVLETVLRGNKPLFEIKTEMDALYADYNDANADRIGELQVAFEEMDGWNADSDAAALLSNLGITEDLHYQQMKDLAGNQNKEGFFIKLNILKTCIIIENFTRFLFTKNTSKMCHNTVLFLTSSMFLILTNPHHMLCM